MDPNRTDGMPVPLCHHIWHVLDLDKVYNKNLENVTIGNDDFVQSMENTEKVLIRSLKFGRGSMCVTLC